MGTRSLHSIRLATVLGLTLAALVTSAEAQQIIQHGNVTENQVSPANQQQDMIDFAHAKHLPRPTAPESAAVAAQQDMINNLVNRHQASAPAASGHESGAEGDGKENPVNLVAPALAPETTIEPQDFGALDHPFTTAKADLQPNATNSNWPYRASGRLFFKIGSDTYVCSASLIKRGVIVTAAHCVVAFGQNQFYSNWHFVPGYRNGHAPYGVWAGSSAFILSSYLTGASGECLGAICQDDIGVITLAPHTTGYPGTSTGWYGYGWNGWGFTANALTQITQIGYPVGLDNGMLMERNDSYGYTSPSNLNNTIIGSNMNGGSSGGPWINNFGLMPTLTGETSGPYPTSNMVVGVTSWGYSGSLQKEMGASPFLSTNIVSLINAACAGTSTRCK
jgi:V8-like Glu-specific endopeptidase